MAARRKPAVGFPALLIIAGSSLLAYNLGAITWSPLLAALTLWPLILVAIGLDVVLARAPRLVAALACLLVLGGLTVLAVMTEEGKIGKPPPIGEAHELSIPTADAESASLKVRFHAGEVRLAAATAGSAELIHGSAYTFKRTDLTVRDERSDNAADISIRNRSGGFAARPIGPLSPSKAQMLDLRLSREVPLDITLEGYGAELDLDFTNLYLSELDVSLDAGYGKLKLPEPQADVKADIDLEVGDIMILIPDNVEARVRVSSDISSINIDSERFPHRRGRTYESPGFASAEQRWSISVRSSLGIVRVR
jgi:hypothetical protein